MPVAKTKRVAKKEPTLSHYDDVAYTLAEDRRVNLYGQVGDEQLSHIDNMLSYLIAKDKKKPIQMQMNTPGGAVTSGLAIYDAIMRKRKEGTPIDILVQGASMSMGVIILQAARWRRATPHSQFLLHQVSYGNRDHLRAQEDELEVARKLQKKLDTIIISRSGITPEKLNEMIERRDANISAQEALELNLIDAIVV